MSSHKKYVDKAFAKQLPSAFIVASPFQLLCAIEAIHEFEIEKYRIAFILERNSPRNQQMYAMAKKYGIEYDVYWMGEGLQDYNTHTGDFANDEKNAYARIFIGDYYPIMYNKYAAIYGQKGAVMQYMDDGNSTILFLKGVYKAPKPKNWRKRLSWYRNRIEEKRKIANDLEKRYGVHESNCFFTIYDNITSKKFHIYPNRLSYVQGLANQQSKIKNNTILIVGTIPQVIAEEVYHVPLSLIEAIHWQKFEEIRNKYPNDKIVYIPHNRDNNQIIPKFCSMLNIEYRIIDEPIEIYTLKSDIIPIAIYGFRSSALMVFNRMFPYVEITSWEIMHSSRGNEDRNHRVINEYYKGAGIKEEIIWLPKGSKIKQVGTGFCDNVKSILGLIIDKIAGKK